MSDENKELQVIEKEVMQTANEFLEKSGTGKDLTPYENQQFLQLCKAFKLNPFKREIYAIVYCKGDYRTCSIVIGYEVFLKRAYQSKMLNGWRAWTEGEIDTTDVNKSTLKACIEIHRKDWEKPFYHEVLFKEYVGLKYDKATGKKEVNAMWKSKPITMIKKVVIGQGFRLCAPEELEGMPYLEEEIDRQVSEPKIIADCDHTTVRNDVMNETKTSTSPEPFTEQEIAEIKKQEALELGL